MLHRLSAVADTADHPPVSGPRLLIAVGSLALENGL